MHCSGPKSPASHALETILPDPSRARINPGTDSNLRHPSGRWAETTALRRYAQSLSPRQDKRTAAHDWWRTYAGHSESHRRRGIASFTPLGLGGSRGARAASAFGLIAPVIEPTLFLTLYITSGLFAIYRLSHFPPVAARSDQDMQSLLTDARFVRRWFCNLCATALRCGRGFFCDIS